MKKILIVDEKGIFGERLSTICQLDYEVLQEKNSKKALTIMAANQDISAVLFDLMEMDGFDFLKEIRQNHAYDQMAVIVQISAAADEKQIKALEMGVDEFIFASDYQGLILHRIHNILDKFAQNLIQSIVRMDYDYIACIDVKSSQYMLMANDPHGMTKFSKQCVDYAESIQLLANKMVRKEEGERFATAVALENVKKMLGQTDVFEFIIRLKKADGKIMIKKLQFSYLDARKEQILFTRVDVTKIFEEEQWKNEVLKEALEDVERAIHAESLFFSRISHDICTPMNAIIGMTRLAKEDVANKERLIESLDVIDQSTQELWKMIHHILDMSQDENRRFHLVRENMNFPIECQNMIEMVMPYLEQKKQTLVVKTNMTHRYFLADVMKFKRVVVHLLHHASRATLEKGEILFTINEIPTNSHAAVTLQFSVMEQGVKRAAEVGRVAAREAGFSIAKRLVASQGGTIAVENREGKGICFTVSIPMQLGTEEKQETQKTQEKQENTEIDLTEISILLIEDHPINTLVAKRLLERNGATVETAENGAEGYEKFANSPEGTYHIVFMDIQMPVMNGYEATKAIRSSSHPQAKDIPIYAMTTSAFTEDITAALVCGMDGHIAKPIDINLLFATLQKHFK